MQIPFCETNQSRKADGFQQLRTIVYAAFSALFLKNASNSSLICSLRVEHIPCGAQRDTLWHHADRARTGMEFLTVSMPDDSPSSASCAPAAKSARSRKSWDRLSRAQAVHFNAVVATRFKVLSDTFMVAQVPSGATTGVVTVTTSTGTLTGNKSFVISQ